MTSPGNRGLTFQRAAIWVHRSRPEAHQFAIKLVNWLEERHVQPLLDAFAANYMGRPELTAGPDSLKSVDFLITLGGDGLILKAAHQAAIAEVPILGVHMGRFGFIAESHPDELLVHLSAVLDGEIEIEERMMVCAEVWRDGKVAHSGVGLNEALVKSGVSHMLRMRTRIAGAEFATYPADGLIISTPTGSTAYSLSAGGPLVAPTLQALLITPICPHTLSARPMLVPAEEVIEIETESDGERIFAIDGEEPLPLQSGDKVVVRRAPCVTRLIRLDPASFYRKVRARYLYGERVNE